ncbi:MAG: hypothetical protein KA473_16820 [Anaerolineales bacterium]|nr:hypothetical protein [Anaerolineales bacterium]MBP6211097.1 hypothetical protein [Anaerolineales bacterium]MBP8164005.1 hypothetical protein [Anaerolineales bacterium]
MQKKKMFVTMIVTGLILTVAAVIWLGTAQPVSAQCGSQASTCKDCHEVQGQMPVNADGTGWHQSHAFGDFCYICHAGNQQAAEKDAAHTGMVSPFADTKASCQQCHPKDLDERAKVYMDILGVSAGSAAPVEVQQVVVTICEPTNEPPADTSLSLSKPAESIDYIARYNENVLGNKPVNWSMIGLVALAVIVVFGGLILFVIKMGWVIVTFEKPVKAEPKE